MMNEGGDTEAPPVTTKKSRRKKRRKSGASDVNEVIERPGAPLNTSQFLMRNVDRSYRTQEECQYGSLDDIDPPMSPSSPVKHNETTTEATKTLTASCSSSSVEKRPSSNINNRQSIPEKSLVVAASPKRRRCVSVHLSRDITALNHLSPKFKPTPAPSITSSPLTRAYSGDADFDNFTL